MKKYFLMAAAAVLLMTQFADAGLLARLRSRRESRGGQPAAAAPAAAGSATPAPAGATPAPAPAPTTTTPPPAPATK